MRRTEITAETREVLIFRRREGFECWCDQCERQVRMVGPEEAAATMGISLRLVFLQIEVGKLHFKETDQESVFICVNSLLN
jgi:hypothetical protein